MVPSEFTETLYLLVLWICTKKILERFFSIKTWNIIYQTLQTSGHTVHCLRHDSISGPAIGPFFSMFIWKNFFFILAKVGQWKEYFFSFSKFWKGVFVKKKIKKKIEAVPRETEFKTEFPELRKPLFKISKMKKKNYSFHCPTFAKIKKKFIKWNLTRESELISIFPTNVININHRINENMWKWK